MPSVSSSSQRICALTASVSSAIRVSDSNTSRRVSKSCPSRTRAGVVTGCAIVSPRETPDEDVAGAVGKASSMPASEACQPSERESSTFSTSVRVGAPESTSSREMGRALGESVVGETMPVDPAAPTAAAVAPSMLIESTAVAVWSSVGALIAPEFPLPLNTELLATRVRIVH